MASFQQGLGRTRLKGLSSVPPPCPFLAVPTSEDVDRELSRPRLFFPGGLLLVLKESLLPAKRGNMGDCNGARDAPGRNSSPQTGLDALTLRKQPIGPWDRAVRGRQGSRQGREGHRELHIEDLQSLLLGCQAEDLLLEPLVFLLQRMQGLKHLHNFREKRRSLRLVRHASRRQGQREGQGLEGKGYPDRCLWGGSSSGIQRFEDCRRLLMLLRLRGVGTTWGLVTTCARRS